MVKRCPPGVICFENYTIFFIFVALFIFVYLYFMKLPASHGNKPTSVRFMEQPSVTVERVPMLRPRPGFGYNTTPDDILLNPYAPPLNDERYVIPSRDVRRGIPINVKTQGGDAAYRQVGILTSTNNREQILPLMGRPLITNRDNWQYYTMSEKNNIKLPVSRGNKSCTNEYGCDKLYDGDNVYIQGYNDVFNATIYDNDTIQYIPYL
jgi:hypothetical protein